jgi:hypothetical protein
MQPEMASALASQHRHEMTAKASHHAQAAHAALATQVGETAGTCPAAEVSPPGQAGRGAGPRRPHLPGALLPRYRVSWSRTALSTPAADGARRGHSWVIVISATRSF